MAGTPHWIDRLKKRWQVTSTRQVVIILIVFSCTGFTVLYVEDFVRSFLAIPDDISFGFRVLVFILITLPIYQVLLLFYGFVFGQFGFFWNFEKRFFRRIFGIKKENKD